MNDAENNIFTCLVKDMVALMLENESDGSSVVVTSKRILDKICEVQEAICMNNTLHQTLTEDIIRLWKTKHMFSEDNVPLEQDSFHPTEDWTSPDDENLQTKLNALQHVIAPSVEKLRISCWPEWSNQPHAHVLVSSLRQWANTLHHLHLYAEEERRYPPTPIFPPPIDTVFPSLIHLSYLYISSVQLVPASLQAASAPLKKIHYWATTLAEWEELQWSLAKPEVLPSLERCTVSLAPEKGSRFSSFAKRQLPEGLRASLRKVGASRGVEMVKFYP